MPTRTTRTLTRRTILRVTELERRDTPAWWTVTAPTPADGTAGSTAATHAGQLAFAPNVSPAGGVATVWADTATDAATQALAGTITVTVAGQSTDYSFGPDAVGTTAADHKAFLAVVSGTSVALSFEDMAGQPGCDYDYNDRTWSAVSAAPAQPPVIAQATATWAGAGNATVTSTVTAVDAATYKWDYAVHNNSFAYGQDDYWGIGIVVFGLPDVSAVTGSGGTYGSASTGLFGGSNVYWEFGSESDPGLKPGGSADFWFTTLALPVVSGSGDGWEPGVAVCTSGLALAPTVAVADVTIDGDLTVGATNPVVTAFSPNNNTNEDTIGGLVVRNPNNKDDNNIVKRQQITIQKLKDAAGNPAVGGQVTLTVPGQVKLFDRPAGGNTVPTGTVFDSKALPKTFWVEGSANSATMRDAKIKAEPAGNPAGADDVSFSVLWVDVVVATSKTISADNDKRQAQMSITFDASGKNTDALGIARIANGDASITYISWVLEGQGLVHPADFSYPGSDLSLRRVWDYKLYVTPPAGAGQASVEESNGFKEDSSDPDWQDNNPLDSRGYIYDLDTPGYQTGLPTSNKPQGTVVRYRANFKEAAAITINGTNTRASGLYAYYVRFSLVQTGVGATNKWAVITPPDIPGDNTASGPAQTSLNANLN